MNEREPVPRRRRAKLDNVALVSASLLLYKTEWQEIARELPKGDVLIVLPTTDKPSRQVLEHVAALLQADGYRVTCVDAEQFSKTDGHPDGMPLRLFSARRPLRLARAHRPGTPGPVNQRVLSSPESGLAADRHLDRLWYTIWARLADGEAGLGH